MGNLLNFAVYNPAILKDEDFLAGFVARQALAESLLQKLKRLEPGGAPEHRLILGQRGMGKTSLLRRIALGVGQDETLAARFLPLSFREEQYNVHNLRSFWNNCLDALGDCLEKAGQQEQADALDKDVARLERCRDAEGDEACRLFKDYCKRQGKRPLLLLDNIDIILDGLAKQDWAFRRFLQERGGAVVFGATVNPLEATAKIEGAFYDFFQVTVLEKLSFPELTSCLRQLALQRGEDGKKVLNALSRDLGRIHTLYDFTGGNPRTLVLLYLLLELDPNQDVMADLERLLDQVSVLYKARVEDLASQARVVLDAVALNWNPATVATVREVTGLDTGPIAAQLDRLQKNGIIEKTELSTPTAYGYQLGERLFNIWYLMRHGQRRQRNRLRWLSEFLRGFYGQDGLRDMARGMAGRGGRNSLSGGMYSLAMREAMDEPVFKRLMGHDATCLFERHAEESGESLRSFIDLEDLEEGTHTMAELKKAVLNDPREWPEGISAEEFWDLLGGDLGFPQADKRWLIERLKDMSEAGLKVFLGYLRSNVDNWNEYTQLPAVVQQLRAVVREGLAHSSRDLLGVAAAIQRGDDPLMMLCALWGCSSADIPAGLNAEFQAIANQLKPLFTDATSNQHSAAIWHNYGWLSQMAGGYEMAEQAYLEAIKLDPNNARSWDSLGILLEDHLQRYEEAEQAYREAIKLDPNNPWSWDSLGNLLRDHLQRYEEAEQAYREAIKLDPKLAWPWNNLGNLLQDHLQRYEEAEQAYREAIKLDPKLAWPWNNLGNLLQDHLQRYEEAEQAYREAIKLDPEFAWPWNNLGNLLQDHLQRYEEAKQVYGEAIKLTPDDADPWNGLGNVLADFLDRPEEAETAYRQCLAINPEDGCAKGNLAYLLFDQGQRLNEAEAFYQQALAKLPEHGGALLRAYRALTLDNITEALSAFAAAIGNDSDELFIDHFDDLLRVFRLAKKRGYGDKFLAWFDESGVGEQYWPLKAGFEAYIHGEEKLRDINPEVRAAASRIYTSLARLRPRSVHVQASKL